MISNENKYGVVSDTRRRIMKRYALLAILGIALYSTGCINIQGNQVGGDPKNGTTTPTEYSITVYTSGLTNGSIVLKNQINNDLITVSADGAQTFAVGLVTGKSYDVVISQNNTNPLQTCELVNGSGVISDKDITDISITCASNSYAVSGTITGYSGSGLALVLDGQETIYPTSGATIFSFTRTILEGNNFTTLIQTQPSTPSQTCTITDGSGSVPVYNTPGDPSSGLLNGTGDATNIAVDCVTNDYFVAFGVTSLAGSGLTVTLESPAATPIETIGVSSNGNYTFATKLLDLSSYTLVVASNPTGLSQTCTFNTDTGTLAGADISASSHTLNCVTNSYSVLANVSGVNSTGKSVNINVNAFSAVNFAADATGVSLASLADGTYYTITVAPDAGLNCSSNINSGTISGVGVTITVTCATQTWTVAGTITGYSGSTNLELQLNGGNYYIVPGSATSFIIPTSLTNGSNWVVQVRKHPTGPKLCTVTNGSGTNISANVTTVAINCVNDNPPTPTVSGAITSGYSQGGSYFLAGTYTDDSTNTTNYPTYSSNYTYSYLWQTSTSGCTVTGATYSVAALNCSWGVDQAARVVSVRVGFSDGRNVMSYSSYTNVKVYNPSFTFASPTGSTTSGAGLDPDAPAALQTAIYTASSAGRSKVAALAGTYNLANSIGIYMSNGVSVYGRYVSGTNWETRYNKLSYALTSGAQSKLNHTFSTTSTWAYVVYFSSAITSATTLDGFVIMGATGPWAMGIRAYLANNVTIQNNYIIMPQTGLGTSYNYGVYNYGSGIKFQKNVMDVAQGSGYYVYLGHATTANRIHNNAIRVAQGYPIYVAATGGNSVQVYNNSLANTYGIKDASAVGVMLYGTSATNEPYNTLIYNNIMYARYGVYELNTTSNPYNVYNNDMFGPTGYTVYYDQSAYCTTNYDADANSRTCNAADLNANWSKGISRYATYGNLEINPNFWRMTEVVGSSLIDFWFLWPQTTNVDVVYGGRTGTVSDDIRDATRTTSTNSTIWGAGGYTMGAYEK